MNPWYIEEREFDPKKLHGGETVYTIGNGYFGTRGTFEEGYPKANPGTLLFGVFDKIAIAKEELANAPDWLAIKLFVNDERFRLDQGKILDYHRILDMQHGILRREVRWESPRGIRIRITSERFASLADEHVGVIRYSLTAEEQHETGGKLNVLIWSALNMNVGNYDLIHWEPVEQRRDGELLWLQSQTRHSSVQLVQTMSFTSRDCEFQKELIRSDTSPSIRIYKDLAVGETMTVEKVVVMYTSRDVDDPLQTAIEHHHKILQSSASPAESGMHYTVLVEGTRYFNPCIQIEPYETLLAEHKKAWQDYWRVSDVIIEGDDKAQQAVRYNIYQLCINASSHDSRYSIAAKGLTGFGYRGHVFHDTEIFMLPYFTFVHPDIARNLLMYRYRLLPAARAKAKSNGYEGAQYPWESTLNGEETTPPAIVHPETGELVPVLNGQIELHITASIAHGVWQYWQFTGDDEFMREYGTELLLYTAEFWASRVVWNPESGQYEIDNVIGPDEWHEHVNNNAFTNYMARWNIQAAIDALRWLKSTYPDKAKELTQQLDLHEKRLAHWHDVITYIRIPLDKRTGLIEQFDGFFKLELFDQEKYKGRTTSYQGILGIKVVQYYQIIKQADVLMLLTTLDKQFDLKTKKVNWEYYYPITDHDYGSSLTPAFHVILACELGLVETAYHMFMKGALVDLEDQRGNSDEGIHCACAGAVWQAAILGFAGLRFTDDGYTTAPCWPEGWTRLAFTCFHKGKQLSIDLRK
ncbi:MAG: glycoside hydrolase family 65 protein [Ktedonobacteraceae bacterium]